MSDWDVDKYKSPHEPSHQWALRRKFMLQNKDRFPEIKVVCLGQTFANIEFMGCRYPKETMELVEVRRLLCKSYCNSCVSTALFVFRNWPLVWSKSIGISRKDG